MSEVLKGVLVVIDVQNDFCPGGALEVKNGDQIVPIINRLSRLFPLVVATQDWHPSNHVSFASNHPGAKPFETRSVNGTSQVLWPDHCVKGTRGADFHPDLDTSAISLILRKGTHPGLDSYSGFFENDRETPTGLEYYLKGLGYSNVYLCGLATDFCVFFSAIDAARLGFKTYLIEDACRGVDVPEGNVASSMKKMRDAGVVSRSSGDLD